MTTAQDGGKVNRNEYREYFLGRGVGVRRPVRRAATLPTSYVDCLDIWDSQPPETFRVFPAV